MLIYETDVISNPSRANVQTLLMLCLVDELAIQPGTAVPVNVARIRLAAAIRMVNISYRSACVI